MCIRDRNRTAPAPATLLVPTSVVIVECSGPSPAMYSPPPETLATLPVSVIPVSAQVADWQARPAPVGAWLLVNTVSSMVVAQLFTSMAPPTVPAWLDENE